MFVSQIRKQVLRVIQLYTILITPLLVLLVLAIRISKRNRKDYKSRRVVFGGCGMINYAYWSNALKKDGVDTRTVVWATPSIYAKDTFDYDLQEKWGLLSYFAAPWVFLRSVTKADVIVCGFDGFVLGFTNLRRIEIFLIQLVRCRIVLFPYGGDSFVYRSVRSESLAHGLQISYPEAARRQDSIDRDVRRNVKRVDFLCPGVMAFDGFGRWDTISPSSLAIDTDVWFPRKDKQTSTKMTIAHSPNHRGFKGTEFLIEAVNQLISEGLEIELILLEKVSNESVRQVLANQADVLVEQLIAPGYGLSGVEGLASGVVVVANLTDNRIFEAMRRWSFMNECPVVSASPETIKQVLFNLYHQKDLRTEISQLSRQYALKYHSYESFQELYKAIDAYLFEKGPDLINFFHPILGKSNRQNEKLKVPVVLNQLSSDL